jgi:hypothetical protein
VPRFGKDKNGRNEELDRQAAEEVERLTRRGMAPGMGGPGMPGMGGPPRMGPPSPLEMMAAEVADRPPPSRRRAEPARRPAPKPQQAFTPMPSGEVGSSFGPGGLNPGPRGGFAAPPPPAFGGGAYDEDYGGHVTGPPVYNAGEADEDEEMSITEMALMDHAARTGHNPEDLVMMYDAGSAEEMRDRAMRQFYERQASRGPSGRTNDPFAPAGTRAGPSGAAPLRRRDDPAAAGGALAQRLAARRRREEEEARRSGAAAEPAPATRAPSAAAARPAPAEREVDDGALSRVLARRRAALGVDAPAPAAEPQKPEATGRRHAAARGPLRAVPEPEPQVATVGEVAEEAPTRSRKPAAEKPAATKAPAAKKATKAPAAKTTKAPAKAPGKAPAKKAAPAAKTKKAGATLAAPAKRATAAKKTARPAGKAKTIFCIECGEKNPAIAKFCFNCGTRLAAPEG